MLKIVFRQTKFIANTTTSHPTPRSRKAKQSPGTCELQAELAIAFFR